ncbi:hypothetical protein FB451DRAFT_1176744 [Mycena latifolia]|nr:hypothetical protein FB451DRAFT_1176744 [Mycena latifolia]
MYAALRLSILGFLLAATGRRLVTVAIPPETIIGGSAATGPFPPPARAVLLPQSRCGTVVGGVGLKGEEGVKSQTYIGGLCRRGSQITSAGIPIAGAACVSLYDFSLSARHVLATSSRRFPHLRVWNLSCPLPEQGFFHEVSLIP